MRSLEGPACRANELVAALKIRAGKVWGHLVLVGEVVKLQRPILFKDPGGRAKAAHDPATDFTVASGCGRTVSCSTAIRACDQRSKWPSAPTGSIRAASPSSAAASSWGSRRTSARCRTCWSDVRTSSSRRTS